MPCGRDDLYYSSDNCGLTHEQEKKLKKLDNLEASLCAILRELEKSNNTHIIDDAEKNGKVNIQQFKKDHFAEDDSRINKLLDGLSQHEIEMLKSKLK